MNKLDVEVPRTSDRDCGLTVLVVFGVDECHSQCQWATMIFKVSIRVKPIALKAASQRAEVFLAEAKSVPEDVWT
jgi:hypothetical protein